MYNSWVIRSNQQKKCSGASLITCLSPSLMTPLSIISLYKSLPSRVRSPTPAKTEKPPVKIESVALDTTPRTHQQMPAHALL